jgi:large subunit ribosomal protein L21
MVAEPGDRIELKDVLLVSDDGQVTVGTPNVANAHVVVEVLDHGRGKKVINFKYKAKVRYRRKRGHRQGFTRLRIAEVHLGNKVAKAADRITGGANPRADVGEQMATMTGAEAAEDAIEATATAATPERTVPTGRRNRTVRNVPEAGAVDTPVGEGIEEITGAEAIEEVIEAQAESETPTGRRRRRPAAELTEDSKD